MDAVIERRVTDSAEEQVPTDGLFVVWFDVNCGHGTPDWWWEVPGPRPLLPALDLAAELRADGWLCKVMPDSQNPRPDGRWDNP
jgi:hypothetical protein